MRDADGAVLPPAEAVALTETRPWRRGLLWLLFLGPFFFASYGFANWWAAGHGTPGVLAFEWERRIPFLAWTIVPYWSIDLLYGLSFLLCRNRRETDRHAQRLLTAQLISVACFILFPLRFSFERPPTDGLFGRMFDILMGFDQPFNQAPSLHISLLLILWVRYAAASRGSWRLAVHGWALLIGLSVLTTYQHHFIDVPTGLLAGAFSLWLWPDQGPSPLAGFHLTPCPTRRRLAFRYFVGALACVLGAWAGGIALWLLWPAAALALVAFIYAWGGARSFQKSGGDLSCGATLILLPYLAGAWLNSRWWTHRHPAPDEIADDVWLGRLPSRYDLADRPFAAVLDLTAELPCPADAGKGHANLPWLDLVPPCPGELARAADEIARLRREGPVLVCCALGYSRSACAVAAWLLASGRARGVDEAVALIAARRPRLVLGPAHRAALATLVEGKTDGV
ncbi:MAG: serine/threonine protein phosphatase [Rhodocyclaceae bacterium]|nr:serine/threonine protein phosphatase [Rhodocyclaceae bacterium]